MNKEPTKPERRWRMSCPHYVFGSGSGLTKMCRLEVLVGYVLSLAKIYWVGLGPPPLKECLKQLEKFKTWTKYCPKCGVKIDYRLIEQDIEQALKGGGLHPKKRGREDCADCPCPERHCSECINGSKQNLKATKT